VRVGFIALIEFIKNRMESFTDSLLDKGEVKSISLLLLYNFLLMILVSCLLFIKLGDFEKVSNAKKYRLGTTLYGINPSGDYEPIAEYYHFRRVLLPDGFIGNNPENKIVRSFIAMEDSNFSEHFGIDIRGIIRAFFVNLMAGRIKEGASTITQQVARLKFLTLERSYIRKIREAWLALLLEMDYSKDEILSIYLNEVPLGHGNRGIIAASEFYFNKNYENLSWGEASLLAALTTRPNYYSPLKNPHESMAKVKVVFRRLIESGELSLPEAEAEWKKLVAFYSTQNRSPAESAFSNRLNRVPWFTEYTRRILEKRYGKQLFYEGGLKIYSSLDIQMQENAQKIIFQGTKKQSQISNVRKFKSFDYFDDTYGISWNLISEIFNVPYLKASMSRQQRKIDRYFQKELRDELFLINYLSGNGGLSQAIEAHYQDSQDVDEIQNVEGALVTLEVKTGKIKALVGGSKFVTNNQLIRAVDTYRQPGSSFKPILIASALEYSARHPDIKNPVTPASLFNDTPKIFLMTDGAQWEPQNYSPNYSGFILLRRALELSKNMVAIQIPEYIGLKNIHPIIEEITNVKKRSGTQTRVIPYNYSIALGSFELSPLEMAASYGMFANNGIRVRPISIMKVTDYDGNVIDDFYSKHQEKKAERVVSPSTAQLITSMLKGVIKSGTGRGVISAGFSRSAAGKTGTTDNQRDAWFVGYTPRYVTAIWLGYDRANMSLGRGATGGGVAAPLWGKYMAKALAGKPYTSFKFSGSNVIQKTICEISGKLPNTHCGKTKQEFFNANNVPKEVCNDHYGYEIETIVEDGIKIIDPLKNTGSIDQDKFLIKDKSLE
jgi:penicillin-binding protein 1A